MATAHGCYRNKEENKNETLCFICAVQTALAADPKASQIHFEGDNYEFYKCDRCGEYIADSVVI